MGAKDIQKRMQELQNSDDLTNSFSRLVSGGKSNYKTVIEKSKEEKKCPNCENILKGTEKFCPECGKNLKEDNSKESE